MCSDRNFIVIENKSSGHIIGVRPVASTIEQVIEIPKTEKTQNTTMCFKTPLTTALMMFSFQWDHKQR